MCDFLPENCTETLDTCPLFMECVRFEMVRGKLEDMWDERSGAAMNERTIDEVPDVCYVVANLREVF